MLRTCSRVCCSSHALCPLSLWRWQEGSTFDSRRRAREKNLNGVHAEMPLRPSYQCTIVTRIMVNAGERWIRTYLGHEYYVLRTRVSSHDSREWEGIHDALDMAQQAPARPLLSTSPSSPSRGIFSRMRPSEASSVKLDACQRRFVGLMPCAQSQQAV